MYDKKNNDIKWDVLKDTIEVAERFLDNVVDVNEFVFPEFEEKMKGNRKIGIGLAGFAHLLIKLGIRYDSQECLDFIDNLSSFIKEYEEEYNTILAIEKGDFPNWKDSIFAKQGIKRRNATISTQAPTGSIATILGTESYGIEPLFSVGYIRRIVGEEILEVNQLFKQMLHDEIKDEIKEQEIMKECISKGTTNLDCVPQRLRELFRCANDISPEWHVKVMAQLQKYYDNAISKTVNLAENATKEDVKNVYKVTFELGGKGCTVYRNNSRDNQTIQIGNKEESQPQQIQRGEWKDVAEDTEYYRRKIYIGCGKLNLFIGYSQKEKSIQDLYVVRSGNGGCERNLQAMVIAMSGMLRLGGNIFNIEKAFEGVGGCPSFASQRAKGEKLNQGNSCGIAILYEIKKFLKEIEISESIPYLITANKEVDTPSKPQSKNVCPECGEELQLVEGCISCRSCGFSKCN